MHKTIKKRPAKIFRRQSRKALTLIEVIVAALLLGSALVPILKALTQVNMNSVIIERRTQSLCLAQAKLDQIQAQSIYDFNSIIITTSTPIDEVLSGSYHGRTTVGGSDDLKTIKLDVGMHRNPNSTTLDDDEIEITLQTQIARRW
jgi:type II secretory pathway pseudopilin PulG